MSKLQPKLRGSKVERQPEIFGQNGQPLWADNLIVACYAHAHTKRPLKSSPAIDALRWLEENPPSTPLQKEIADLTVKVWQAKSDQKLYRKLKDQLNELKERQLLCLMLAGHSKNGEHSDEALKGYTGILLHDIDGIFDEGELKDIIKLLKDKYPYASCIKISISKVGLHIITFTTATLEQHDSTWDKLADTIEFITGHSVDRSTRSKSRLCFNSQGPFIWKLDKPRFDGVAPEPKRLHAAVNLPSDWPHNLNPFIEKAGITIKGDWHDYKEEKRKIFVECLTELHSKRGHAAVIANEDGSVQLTCFNKGCQD